VLANIASACGTLYEKDVDRAVAALSAAGSTELGVWFYAVFLQWQPPPVYWNELMGFEPREIPMRKGLEKLAAALRANHRAPFIRRGQLPEELIESLEPGLMNFWESEGLFKSD